MDKFEQRKKQINWLESKKQEISLQTANKIKGLDNWDASTSTPSDEDVLMFMAESDKEKVMIDSLIDTVNNQGQRDN